jgi:prevent-host-death family protein
MAHRVIPQRELRNNVSGVLREAAAGGTFTVTVRGRPVARVGPAEEGPQKFVEVEAVRRLLAEPIDADALAADLDAAEAPVDDPWTDG